MNFLPVATAAEALLYDFVAEAIQSVSPCLYKRDTAEIKGTRYPEGKVITVSDSKVIGFPIPIEEPPVYRISGADFAPTELSSGVSKGSLVKVISLF